MIFPFKITRHFKLPDKEFGDYSNTEIIDNIYKYLSKEEFKSLKKENNEIVFTGNKSKRRRHVNWSKTDRITHCIDTGIVRIDNTGNQRKLVYTFQIWTYFIGSLVELIFIPILFSLFFLSIREGLVFFWILLAFNLFYWLFLIIFHPATVSAPIEIMRCQSVGKRNKNVNCNC